MPFPELPPTPFDKRSHYGSWDCVSDLTINCNILSISIWSGVIPDLQKVPIPHWYSLGSLPVMLVHVPTCWKFAAIKLIGKNSAIGDPIEFPSNCPNIMCWEAVHNHNGHRWMSFMLENGYIDKTTPKAFMSFTTGCTEHQASWLPSSKAQGRNKNHWQCAS